MRQKLVFRDRIAVTTEKFQNLQCEESSPKSTSIMEKDHRMSGSRVVRLVRRPSDRHPMGGMKLERYMDTFVFEIIRNSSADSAGLSVGDVVEEVNGIPCRDFMMPELELVIAELLQEGGVSLRVRSSQRIILRNERGNTHQIPPQTKRMSSMKGYTVDMKKATHLRRNLFPTVHPNQTDDMPSESIHAEIDTPHRRISPRKCNMDKEARLRGIDPPPRQDAATNTECVLSYFVSARAYREWLRTQRKADCREPGNFSKNVKIYNSMIKTKGRRKGSKDGKKRQSGELAPETKSSQRTGLTKTESQGTSPANHKMGLGAALSSVGRLLPSRKALRRTPK